MSVLSISPVVLGERLRIARSGANLTQEAAAEVLGLSRTTIVAIEAGQRGLKPDELLAFAKAYGLSVGRLTAPDTIHVDLNAKFRRLESKAEAQSSGRAIALLNRLATGAVELERALHVEFKPDYPRPINILTNSYIQQAEDAAVSLRNRLGLGLGKISDLLSSLELDLGIRTFCRPISDGKISGLYAFDPTIGACILVNANHPRRRRAQTLSHEVGHFISDRTHADILDDEATPPSLQERFARRFGPAFLMPAPSVRTRFEQIVVEQNAFDIRALVLLAHQFDVTTEGMCRRLEDLDLLARGTWHSMRDRGFGSNLEHEVLGDSAPEGPPPILAPRLAFLAAKALQDEVLSEGQLCDLLAVDRVELWSAIRPYEFGDLS